MAAALVAGVAMTREAAAAQAAPKRALLIGRIERTGSYELLGKGPWPLKDFISNGGKPEGDVKRLFVTLYNVGPERQQDRVARLPIEVVYDPDVVLYVKPDQVVHIDIGERKKPQEGLRDTEGQKRGADAGGRSGTRSVQGLV